MISTILKSLQNKVYEVAEGERIRKQEAAAEPWAFAVHSF